MKCHLFSHRCFCCVNGTAVHPHIEKADNQVFLLSMVLEISLSFKRFSWQLSDLMGFDICESE